MDNSAPQVSILELEQIAFTHFSVLLFRGGVLLGQVESCPTSGKESDNGESACGESNLDLSGVEEQAVPSSSSPFDQSIANNIYHGPPVLLGVTMEEAGLDPKISCSGTPMEMVCPGGEKAFIPRIIEDSVALKQTFRWFTSMVGQILNLKILTSKLWEVGATVVKTTEFVQGQACRWDLAWTFMPPTRKIISPHVIEKKNSSFMLEVVQRQFSAVDVLHTIESFFHSTGASCKLNSASFTVDITASKDHCNAILKNEVNDVDEATSLSANPWNTSGERIVTALRYPIPRIILINIPTIGGRSES
ncbi:hypothetical protein EZV62_011732 [Acer yangbiense]|uniref:Uncharacterized protein n=1 Tax=Acer yangbiense TaxID=1000413 RepID=A0A5C7I6T7_9ROSI|nr:hypothetical protein EZV62_011732 [Acer yangbiense]